MKWMFEHCEAALTPLGGGTIAHSLIWPAQRAAYHDIRYSRCLLGLSGASNPRTHLAVYTCGSGRLAGVGAFVKLPRHHPVVSRSLSLIHCSVPFSLHHNLKTVTQSSSLYTVTHCSSDSSTHQRVCTLVCDRDADV